MLGRHFRSRSRSRSYNRCSIFLTETVGNAQAQHAVIRTGTHSARVADVVNPLVFQTGSDVTSNSPLYAASKYWGNASVVFATGNAVRSVVAFGVSAPNHAAQTGVDVQIVSDRVTQFSGQLNALSFESTVVNAAFICHTAQPVVTHFETEVRVNLVTTERTSTELIVTGRTIVALETVTVETGVVILGPTQFTTCIPGVIFRSGLRYGSEASQCHCNRDSCLFHFLRLIIIQNSP